MSSWFEIQYGLERWNEYAEDHNIKYISTDRLPKNWVYRPYRFVTKVAEEVTGVALVY